MIATSNLKFYAFKELIKMKFFEAFFECKKKSLSSNVGMIRWFLLMIEINRNENKVCENKIK